MLKPLGVHVLVEPVEEESSFVIPEMKKGEAVKGKVLGVGSAVEEKLEEGATVLFRKYSPEEFKMDGKPVYIIPEEDLMAIEV